MPPQLTSPTTRPWIFFKVSISLISLRKAGLAKAASTSSCEVRPSGGNDLRRGVALVFDLTADHLGQKVAGGVVNGTENGQVEVPVFAQAQIPEPLIEDPLHRPLVGHAPARVVKEALVEIDPGVLVPP